MTAVDTTGLAGLLVWLPNGSFAYDPNGQFDELQHGQTATESFVYSIAMGRVEQPSAPGDHYDSRRWRRGNTAPTADDDQYSTLETTALTVPVPGVLGNDSDPDLGDVMVWLPSTLMATVGPGHMERKWELRLRSRRAVRLPRGRSDGY